MFFNFSDDVTRTMSKGGGVLVKNPVSAPGSPPFKNPGSVPASVHKTKVKIWYAYKVYFSVHM